MPGPAAITRRKLLNSAFTLISLLATVCGGLALLALFLGLACAGWPRLTPHFFISYPSRFPDQAGILSAWVGTTIIMTVTALLAVPLGVAAAIYLEEYAMNNRLTALIEITIANLAGVPSIVYGLLVPGLFLSQFHLGPSILTASLTLAVLILPIVITSARETLRSIPANVREAAVALGASRWQMVKGHVLPYSAGGILTGLILALSRAIGESAPLITVGALSFIAFLPTPPWQAGFPYLSFRWLLDPFTVMPIQMFNWVSRPQEAFHRNAAAAGLVLMGMTLAMNGLAIYLRYRFRKQITW